MSKNKAIILLGVLIALLPTPFIALPGTWETAFQVLAGLLIVTLSVWSILDKKLTLKAKAAQRRQAHKKRITEAQAYITQPQENPGEEVLQEERF